MEAKQGNVQYRMTTEQLNEMRDAMDDLDASLTCARRTMERLTDLRNEMRTQQVGVTEAK